MQVNNHPINHSSSSCLQILPHSTSLSLPPMTLFIQNLGSMVISYQRHLKTFFLSKALFQFQQNNHQSTHANTPPPQNKEVYLNILQYLSY